jgi:hypothetical protein
LIPEFKRLKYYQQIKKRRMLTYVIYYEFHALKYYHLNKWGGICLSFWGNYFFPHELPGCVILPPRTTTSTKREHQTTIFTHFAPFRQSNSCKDLNDLTQFQK